MTLDKRAKWIYWALTVSVVFMMMSGGAMLLAGAASNVDGITQLGYPAYVCKILGVAKILGGIAILFGRFPTLKEWAYAGFAFNLIGAVASHTFYGHSPGKVITPVILLGLVLVSYRLWKNSLAVTAN